MLRRKFLTPALCALASAISLIGCGQKGSTLPPGYIGHRDHATGRRNASSADAGFRVAGRYGPAHLKDEYGLAPQKEIARRPALHPKRMQFHDFDGRLWNLQMRMACK